MHILSVFSPFIPGSDTHDTDMSCVRTEPIVLDVSSDAIAV
jgi:hypothetical protein